MTDFEAKARELISEHTSFGYVADRGKLVSAIVKALGDAAEAERERCAKIAEASMRRHRNYAYDIDSRPSSAYAEAVRLARECEAIAASIRNSEEKDNG